MEEAHSFKNIYMEQILLSFIFMYYSLQWILFVLKGDHYHIGEENRWGQQIKDKPIAGCYKQSIKKY